MTTVPAYEIAQFLREDRVLLVSGERGEELFECHPDPAHMGKPCHITGKPLATPVGWLPASGDNRLIAEETLKSLPKA